MTKIDILADDVLKRINEDGVFEGYEGYKFTKGSLPELKDVFSRTIIHMYPYKDTAYLDKNNDVQLDWLSDALMCKIVIYDLEKMTYSILENVDNVDNVDIAVPAQTRIFKDGSTLIKISGFCRIGVGKSTIVVPVGALKSSIKEEI